MAKREGGVPRAQAIERAQTEVERAGPSFDEWLKDALRNLQRLIAKAEAAESSWIEDVNAQSRQLRDSSGTLGIQLLAFIADSLCDMLDSIELGAECDMESIICHVDALKLAQRKSYRRLKPEQVPELTEGLRRVVKRVAS
jgi:hypothetical protein